MKLTRSQQAIVDAFRAEYEKHNPDVQAAIARSVSWAEVHFAEVMVFCLVVGFLVGAVSVRLGML